jgi:dephospho-CoA kinase
LVGLTGGIGSGKSTAAELFHEHGAVVIDADEIARFVVEPGQPALAALVERFGAEILGADGRLDRPKMAAIAFADEASTKALGEITWPEIGKETERRMAEAGDERIIVLDIPLLIENKGTEARSYMALVVVEAPIDVRLDRLEGRGVARDDALRRMAAQASDEERRAFATHVLDNGGDREALARQVGDVWAELLTLEPPEEPAAEVTE